MEAYHKLSLHCNSSNVIVLSENLMSTLLTPWTYPKALMNKQNEAHNKWVA
jgi:hypothetical protein